MNKRPANTLPLMGIAIVILTFCLLDARDIGLGHVPGAVEGFAKRLDDGIAYQVVAKIQERDSFVVLVKKFGTSDFFAIRVEIIPPEIFTLVDGNPIAIAK